MTEEELPIDCLCQIRDIQEDLNKEGKRIFDLAKYGASGFPSENSKDHVFCQIGKDLNKFICDISNRLDILYTQLEKKRNDR